MKRRALPRRAHFRGTYSFKPYIRPPYRRVTPSIAGISTHAGDMKLSVDHIQREYELESTDPALDLGKSYQILHH